MAGKRQKGVLSVVMFFMFLLISPDSAIADKGVDVVQIDNSLEMGNVVNEKWEEDFYGRMVLDTDLEVLEIDGRETTVSEEFNISEDEAADLCDSGKEIEHFLEEQDDSKIYEVKEKGETIEITSPYQTKRIIAESGELRDFYGAVEVYCNKEMNETYLQFASEEDTKRAYEQMTMQYGEGFCFVDEVFCIDDVLSDTGEAGSVYSWGVSYMGMDTLKQQAKGRNDLKTVKVAVIDTGIDVSNFMFADRTITVDSYNIPAGNEDVKDGHGHGTHVSGTIVDATPDNVQIMSLKVANGLGLAATSYLRMAIEYAVEKNASVINISMGMFDTSGRPMTAYDKAIQAAYDKKIPVCVAAGNDHVDAQYTYPACNPQTLTVSALGKSGQLATYSNRGNMIDFTAPGSDIVSACNGGTTISMDGTSMAAPHVTAAVAYMKMLKPDISVKEVYDELKKYCMDLGETGKDNLYGWGCPNLTKLFQNGISDQNGNKENGNNHTGGTLQSVAKPVLKSAVNTKNGIKIEWTSVKGCTGYYLYRKSGNSKYTKIATLSGTSVSYTDKKTADGKKYTYAVSAYLNKNESGHSNSRQTICISQPKIRNVVKKGKKNIIVRWKKKKGVSGYQIQYSKRKNFSRAKTKKISGKKISSQLKKLSKGKYYIRIRAWSKGSSGKVYSVWSACKPVKIV